MDSLKSSVIGCGGLAVMLAWSGLASAQAAPELGATQSYWDQSVAAPEEAFELTIGSGYTQGFGKLQKGGSHDVSDTAGPGLSVDMGLGYRLSPSWTVGIGGAYTAFTKGDSLAQGESVGGAIGRIDASYHFEPFSRLDPFLNAGAGYRYLCECNATGGRPGAKLHGFELLGLAAGLDIRVDRQIALAPLVGVDLDSFFWNGTTAIADPRLSVFAYGGLQARFDIGGSYARSSSLAVR